MPKTVVGILFGGQSAEHEVSIQSAMNVYEALDKEKYEPVLIGIERNGRWFLPRSFDTLAVKGSYQGMNLEEKRTSVGLVPGGNEEVQFVSATPAVQQAHPALPKVDVVFPILHGPMGEDGTIQGLLKVANIPCVGASVLGSAIGMDKDVMKRLLREADIPICDFVTIRRSELPTLDKNAVVKRLGLPLFVKPANLGSSVGISKVFEIEGLDKALREAFAYDNKVVAERFCKGKEIEIALLGNDDPAISCPGEIRPTHEFYSYEAKYLDPNGATLHIPADLDPEITEKIKRYSKQAFKLLECSGFARIDWFVQPDGSIFLNEINTIPGFTKISMYPKLWEASGVPYKELITKLIDLALERFNQGNLCGSP